MWNEVDDSLKYEWVIVGPMHQGDFDVIHFSLDGLAPLTQPENVIAARKWFKRQGTNWIHPQGNDEWIIDGD